jgi:hypothetical protein
MLRAMIPAAVLCLLAGCNGGGEAPSEEPKKKGEVVFDVNTEFSFKNHFKKSTDPLGKDQVFQTADKHKKMTFVQKTGFFTVPAGHKGRVVLEVLVQKARKLRVTMVGEKKHKSYYLDAPVEGKWFELSLPLADLKEKVAEGEKVVDVTVWIKPDAKGEKLPADAQMFIRGARLLAE